MRIARGIAGVVLPPGTADAADSRGAHPRPHGVRSAARAARSIAAMLTEDANFYFTPAAHRRLSRQPRHRSASRPAFVQTGRGAAARRLRQPHLPRDLSRPDAGDQHLSRARRERPARTISGGPDAMTDFAALLQPDRGQPARAIHVVHPDAGTAGSRSQPRARPRRRSPRIGLTGKPGNRAILPGDGGGRLVGAAGLRRSRRLAVADRLARRASCPRAPTGWRAASPARRRSAGCSRQHRFDRYRKADADRRRACC